MQIGGTLVNAVVRIAILGATLALVYFFIIRPVLDTTDKAFDNADRFSNNISKQVQNSIDQVQTTTTTSGSGPSQKQISRLQREIRKVPPARMSRLNPCIVKAGVDVQRMIRCAERLQ